MADGIAFDTGLRLILESVLGDLHTAFPAQVESFDPLTLRADLQPCLKGAYKGISASNWPVLSEVPVLFMSSGDFHVLYQPKPGSFGLCIVSEKSLDDWLVSGGVVNPSNNRKHDLSDAIFIPGLFPLVSAAALIPPVTAGALEIRDTLGTVSIKLSATGIDITGNVTIDGIAAANAIVGVPLMTVGLASHTHPVSGAATGPPNPGT